MVLRAGSIVADIVAADLDSMNVYIQDITNANAIEDIYVSETLGELADSKFIFSENIEFAGRKWRISFVPHKSYVKAQYTILPWVILIVGTLFSLIIAFTLAQQYRRQDIVEAIVKVRTRELEEANAELEEFAYRTSHDLRSPLVSSVRLIEMSRTALAEGNNDFVHRGLELTERSLKKLDTLVQDILLLTKTKNSEEDKEVIDIYNVMETSIDQLKHLENFDRIEFIRDLKFDGELLLMKDRFNLIFENLLSNAIKYQDVKAEQSRIWIRTFEDNHNFVLEIADNGLGIPKNKREQLFMMFKRFHGDTSFGSGLGLYMIKKSADKLQGSIEFDDSNEQTCFRLKIPI